MKKIIGAVFALLILSTSLVSAQTYQIYVSDIDVKTEIPARGGTVDGTFNLYNISDIPQSDIYFYVSSGSYDEETLTANIRHSASKQGPFYLKAQSRISIPFSYTVPKNLPNQSAIQITVTLKDGTLVGQGNYALTFPDESFENQVSLFASYLNVSGIEERIVPATGPAVYEGETIDFTYSILSELYTSSMTLTPTLKLYNRVNTPDTLMGTIEYEPITLTDDEALSIHTIDLPTDKDPLVYYGVLTLVDSEGVEVLSTDLRYMIAGPTATVRNITTETLEVKKNDTFSALIAYGGQPLDEYRPEKQIEAQALDITVIATNEKGEEVARITQELDLESPERTLTAQFTAQNSAKKLTFSATINAKDGTILSTYQTQLPSEKEVKDQNSLGEKKVSTTLLLSVLLILILLTSLIFFFKKKNSKFKIPTVLFFGILLSCGLIFNMREADAGLSANAAEYLKNVNEWNEAFLSSSTFGQWTVVQAKNTKYDIEGYEFGDSYVVDSFGLNTVTSPLPPVAYAYAPGERFNLTFNATYGDCNNEGRQYSAYGFSPNTDWWNRTPKVDEEIEDRAAWWNETINDRNGNDVSEKIKLINLGNTSTWKQLVAATDLQVMNPNLGDTKESVIKAMATFNDVKQNKLYLDYGRTGRYAEAGALSIKMFRFNEDDGDPNTNQDWLNWVHNNPGRAVRVQKIFNDNTNYLDGSGVKNFDFSDLPNRNQPNSDKSKDFIAKLNNLNGQLQGYTQPALDNMREWYSMGEHGTELTPVTANTTYTAPTTPGYHRLFFYMYQGGNSGRRDFTAVQTICVTGANICPTENVKPVVALTVDNIAQTQARANWTYSDGDGDKQINYKIEVSTQQSFADASKIITIGSGNGDSTQNRDTRRHVMTGLTANTTYYARIQSKSDAATDPKWSDRSNVVTFTTLPNITVPVNQNQVTTCSSVSNVTHNSATANWIYFDADNDAQTNYNVRISTNANFTNIIKNVSKPDRSDATNVRNLALTGLTPSTTYYAQVRTRNQANDWGPYVNCSGSFRTTAQPSFSLTFNKNATGAIGTMSPMSFTAGQTKNLTANAFSRNAGFTFDDWALTATGTKAYMNGASYTMSNPGANKSLFARWKSIPSPTGFDAFCSTDGRSITATWTRESGYESVFFRVSPTSDLTNDDLWDNDLKTNTKTVSVTPGEYKVWIHTKVGNAYSNPSLSKTLTCAPQTYTITYNGNGNTSGTAPANQTKIHNQNLILATNSGNLEKTGFTFSGWNTNSAGNATSYAAGGTYTADMGVTLHAKWTAVTPQTHLLVASKTPTNGGTVASVGPGINCGTDCSETYAQNTNVVLTATPATYYRFINWTGGACTGNTTEPSCTINMTQPRSANALFQLIQPPPSASATCLPGGTQVRVEWTLPSGYDSTNFRFSPSSSWNGSTWTDKTRWLNKTLYLSRTVSVTSGVEYNWWVETVLGETYSTAIGGTITCQAPPAINGSCGTAARSCTAGTLNDSPNDTATQQLWTCMGSNGGTNSPTCAYNNPTPVNGSCGTTQETCARGTLSHSPDDTPTQYRWTCLGSNGGTNSPTCKLDKPVEETSLEVVCSDNGKEIIATWTLPPGRNSVLFRASPMSDLDNKNLWVDDLTATSKTFSVPKDTPYKVWINK